jgi:LmbE family N-acetylglucosaminyl deacetylase
MHRIARVLLLLISVVVASGAAAQEPQTIKGPDERYKVDILVVVAHPDDEGGVTPYLARAIYDLHKTVGVVFGTRGGSGGNDYRREHGPAMADVREIEARQACAKLGIDKVWFLGGKDTASQNVLNSLANWGHGESLEELVRIVRLTRPEIIITWLPSIFIGENHGDHQAAGVLATEAFDSAADAAVFPAQLAGATKRLEPYLENLAPWQPKKIYYFSDARDQKQFSGKGFSYSVREVSPSQKKPYWLLALHAAQPHLTQFPDEILRMSGLTDEQLEKAMSDPNSLWWSEPETLIFGKAFLGGVPTDDVFGKMKPVDEPAAHTAHNPFLVGFVGLGGPWGFYVHFRKSHGLGGLPVAKEPELGIKAGTSFYIPFVVNHYSGDAEKVQIQVEKPENWKVTYGEGALLLPAEPSTDLRVEIATPEVSKDELKNAQPREVTVWCLRDGKPAQEIKMRVQLLSSGLPQ